MNQVHPKSQTTPILYQEPTAEEMRSKTSFEAFKQNAISTLQNISLFVIVATAFIFTSLMILRSCADDVERQQAMAVKHQMQSGGVK